MKAPIPRNEAGRLAALKEYHILDTGTEQSYDDITAVAAHICDVPIAMISLVDDTRQWFKSRVGMVQQETPREVAFCAHAIFRHGPFVVQDAKKDRRFADNPLVTGEPRIRFYAGFPLVNPDGLALGALCAVDQKPRQLSTEQERAMQSLARLVMVLLESRRTAAHLTNAINQVKTLEGLLPICAWCKRIRDDEEYWDRVEAYFDKHTSVDFTHAICPECLKKVQPQSPHGPSRAKAVQFGH
jgi:GAF domain-containing protein